MQDKKTYETPKLIVHGDIQKITLGQGWGSFLDMLVYGIIDYVCRQDPGLSICQTGSR